MTIDSAIAPELLTAEIEAIEDLLVHYEDWRALAQLEIRERKGEVPRSVATSGLKAMLIEKLAGNPLFLRRQTLLKELERATQSVHTPGQPITTRNRQQPDGDDLTRIRGIDARLERRLNALNVRSYDQIASFTLDDVRYVSNTLGLENRIISQMWIEQAQMLADGEEGTPPAASLDALRVRAWPVSRAAPGKAPSLKEPAKASAKVPPPVAAGVPAPKAPIAAARAQPSVPGNTEAAERPLTRADQQPENPRDEVPVADAAATARTVHSSSSSATPVEERKLAAPEALVAPAPAPPVAVAAVKIEEPAYDNLVPPKPISAAKYKTFPPEGPAPAQPAARAKSEAVVVGATANIVPHVEEPDYSKLRPAMPLPGRRYAGAVFEPVDQGVLAGAPPPPKPRPAAAYVTPPAEPDSKPVVTEPRPPEKAPAAAAPRPIAAASARPAEDRRESGEPEASASDDGRRPAEIVGQNLPPLPLRPATVVSPPPPLPRTLPAATTQPVSTSSISTAAPVSGAAQAAAAAAKEAAMLAAAAARPSRPTGPMSAPPPLPPVAPKSDPAGPLRAPPPAPPRAERGMPEQRSSFEEQRSSVPSGEARVTIRRSDEHGTGTVIRTPGATEVHLGREQRRAANFDSKSYAAYHDEVEEASVQIVRRKDAPAKGAGVSVAVSAADAAAKAAAAALTRKVENSAPATPAEPPAAEMPANPPAVAENAKVPIGRFLKALTGQ